MELSLRMKENFAELTISTGNAKITEDVSNYDTTFKRWVVDENFIETLLTIANDLSRFNHVDDVDFVKKVIEFLNESERNELLEWLKQE
jgi:hypothetical protein